MFGCIVAGRLVDVNKYVFELPEAHLINHLPGYAATVHLLWPNKDWQFLGVLSNDKPSAIFRLKSTISPEEAAQMPHMNAELGISIEPVQAAVVPAGQQVSPQTAQAFAQKTLGNLYEYAMSFATRADSSMGLIGSGAPVQVLPTKVFDDWYNNLLRKIRRIQQIR
ncbi:DUF775-domain-containing protein [Linderina pennispora]|uniref:DUF775-domain-containing protein n=1 Tax=Linderina pennispora TaxID=61395 RepID=A0A1Y1VPU1_9FUNG|nr:DUF775-domain-containing protein [Linderina pennispora]ORX63332.1 DUF775-domain-containing protein [Linderina pennispora]